MGPGVPLCVVDNADLSPTFALLQFDSPRIGAYNLGQPILYTKSHNSVFWILYGVVTDY